MGRADRGASDGSSDASRGLQIEFIDTGGAWGDDWSMASRSNGDGRMPDDEPRSRGATIAAIVALVVLIGTGVIAASPWDQPTAAPPVVTNTPSSSTLAPGATAPALPTASSVADVAATPTAMTDGYLVPLALLQGSLRTIGTLSPGDADAADAASADDGRHGWLELWATPGASRTVGSWFAVQYGPMPQVFGEQDGARITVDDRRIGIYRSTADGVHTLTFPTGRSQAEITWFGWSDERIVEMAAGVRFSRSGHPRFADDGFESDHTRLLSRASYGQGLDRDLTMTGVISSALYATEGTAGGLDPARATVTVTTSRADPGLDVLAGFVLSPLPTSERPWIDANGDAPPQGLLLFPDTSSPSHLHLVQQTDATGTTVRITTGLTFAQLAAVLPPGQLVKGTVGDWSSAQAVTPGYTAFRGDTDLSLVDGTFNGVQWDITVTPDRNWVNVFLTWPNLEAAVIQLDLDVRPCSNLAGEEGTLVVCVRRTDGTDARVLLSNDRSGVDTPFTASVEHPEWEYAITFLPDTGTFHAEVVAGPKTLVWDVGPGVPA